MEVVNYIKEGQYNGARNTRERSIVNKIETKEHLGHAEYKKKDPESVEVDAVVKQQFVSFVIQNYRSGEWLDTSHHFNEDQYNLVKQQVNIIRQLENYKIRIVKRYDIVV